MIRVQHKFMTKTSPTLGEALTQCQSTVEACVIVGGTLWKNQSHLESCIQKGITVKLLFPDPSSDWLVSMVSAAGISIEAYAPRILQSATHAQQLGTTVDIRWYKTAITNWFVLIDRGIIWHKMFSLTQPTVPSYQTAKPSIEYYSKLFDSIWHNSEKDLSTVQPSSSQNPSNTLANERLPDLLELLVKRFSEDELKTLCFHLQIDYDDLPADGKTGKARELISFLDRRERVPELIKIGNNLRPDIDWQGFYS